MNHEKYEKALKVWQEGPKIAEEYHDSTGFVSNSFIGEFLKCEYGSVIKYAKIEDKPQGFVEAFAVGHLTEAICFEGDAGYDKMIERYKDNAFDRSKNPRAWVKNSIDYAESITRHKNIKRLLQSDGSKYHQTLIFNLFGMSWRGEIDYLNLNKHVEIDMKTTKSSFTEKGWRSVDGRNIKDSTFIDDWNYHRQRAVYRYGIKTLYDEVVTPHILAVSKKNKSVRLFKFDDQERLDYELASLESVVDNIKEVLAGEREPKKCEECDHCVDAETVEDVILTSSYCAELVR